VQRYCNPHFVVLAPRVQFFSNFYRSSTTYAITVGCTAEQTEILWFYLWRDRRQLILLILLILPVKPSFVIFDIRSGHSDAQPWASECPDVKNYKWWLNPAWHRMLYSCTHVAPLGVKGFSFVCCYICRPIILVKYLTDYCFVACCLVC